MRIEAVTVCVNYSDFLAHSLLLNRNIFDHYVVVTTQEDTKTQKLCRHFNIHCITTDTFYSDGQKFNKGNGINAGLSKLKRDEWVVHLDADIVLPPQTRSILKNAELDPTAIYGIDRTMCPSFLAWMEFLSDPDIQHEWNSYCNPGRFPLGTRIVKPSTDGYIPIGFFQLFHGSAGHIWYPDHSDNAGETDLVFALKWPRSRRRLLPELLAIHLDSVKGNFGKNWKGRTTPYFGPQPLKVPDASCSTLTEETSLDKTDVTKQLDGSQKGNYS